MRMCSSLIINFGFFLCIQVFEFFTLCTCFRSEVVSIEEHCDHSVVAFDLCAICGANLKR